MEYNWKLHVHGCAIGGQFGRRCLQTPIFVVIKSPMTAARTTPIINITNRELGTAQFGVCVEFKSNGGWKNRVPRRGRILRARFAGLGISPGKAKVSFESLPQKQSSSKFFYKSYEHNSYAPNFVDWLCYQWRVFGNSSHLKHTEKICVSTTSYQVVHLRLATKNTDNFPLEIGAIIVPTGRQIIRPNLCSQMTREKHTRPDMDRRS